MLRRWLDDVTLEDFLDAHFQSEPLAKPGVAADEIPLVTWATVERLVERAPRVDVLVVRNGRLITGGDPSTGASALALFRDGCSIVVRGADRYDDGLAGVAASIASELPGDVAVQVYATPAGFGSFGWHYDCEDVFIVQTAGLKRYLLRKNTVNPEPTVDAMPRDMEYGKETSPAVEATLAAGDWLYIPRGFWHVARAEKNALSMSIGVLSPAAGGRRAATSTVTRS